MKNILLCIDFQKETSILVEKAAEVATAFGSRIWVLHVADPDPDFAGYEAGPQFIRDEIAQGLRNEHSTLQNIAEVLNSRGIQAEALLIQGQTVEAILDEARKLNIDLLMLGYAPHSLVHRIFLGESTPRLLRKTAIPLFIVPSPTIEVS